MAATLLSLQAMLFLELPHVNVLSKIDLLARLAPDMRMPLEFYLRPPELAPLLDGAFAGRERFARLNERLADVVEDFGLVAFTPCAVEDRELMLELVRKIDRASGFHFGGGSTNNSVLDVVDASGTQRWAFDDVQGVVERYRD